MTSPTIELISECFVKPKDVVEDSKQPYHLSPVDLSLLSFHYSQLGLLFSKPTYLNDREFSIHSFLEALKASLALTLVHFYPLAGQLVTNVDEQRHECQVYVDCNKGPGARFIHASSDLTMNDILLPTDVPSFIRFFFQLDDEQATNHDGHTKPLLSVQVTELLDGLFIACSINHCLVDGTSYWHFWNRWSEIHESNGNKICESRLPVFKRWFPEGHDPPLTLPFTHPNQFIKKFEALQLREKIYHFTTKSIAKLKAIAIEESNVNNISSFQALCALVWRSMVRANHIPHDQDIIMQLIANTRKRLHPPLPENSFGNFIEAITINITAGELLQSNIGWAASLLHQSVVNLDDKCVRDSVNRWLEAPFCYHHAELHDYHITAIERSPRFDMYGNEFGLGKPVAVRNGPGNKAMGVVFASPGYEGGGSVDLEICLPPDSMNALESDEEFMAFVSIQQ